MIGATRRIGNSAPPRSLDRRTGWLLFTGLSLITLALIPPAIYSIDGNSMYATTFSLVRGEGFKVPCSLTLAGGRGLCFSDWYPLQSVLAVPFVALGNTVARVGDLPEFSTSKVFALVVPALAAAGAAVVSGMLAAAYGATRRRVVFVAFAALFATELLVYARTFFAEALAAFLVGAAVLMATRSRTERRAGIACAVLVGLSVLAKPQLVVVGPALSVALWLAWRQIRPSVLPLVGAIAGGIVYCAFNLYRFGSPLDFGIEREISVARVPERAAVLLLSPGRGLLWFSPIVAVGIFLLWRRRSTDLGRASVLTGLAVLLVYALHVQYGWDWGDRFLTAIIPLLVAPVAMATTRLFRVAVALALVGMLVQLPTIPAFYERYFAERVADGDAPSELVWTIEGSPLVGVWGSSTRQLREAARVDPRSLLIGAGDPASSIDQAQSLKVVALWWWLLPAADVPAGVGAAASIVAVLVGVTLVGSSARGPRTPER